MSSNRQDTSLYATVNTLQFVIKRIMQKVKENRLFVSPIDQSVGSSVQLRAQFEHTSGIYFHSRSQCPRDLRRGSAASPLKGLRVRAPPVAWMSVSCECHALSGRSFCVGLITRLEESYRLCCVWVWSWSLDNEEALARWGLLCQGRGRHIVMPCTVDNQPNTQTNKTHCAVPRYFMLQYHTEHATSSVISWWSHKRSKHVEVFKLIMW
jgi:hypothetical protein